MLMSFLVRLPKPVRRVLVLAVLHGAMVVDCALAACREVRCTWAEGRQLSKEVLEMLR